MIAGAERKAFCFRFTLFCKRFSARDTCQRCTESIHARCSRNLKYLSLLKNFCVSFTEEIPDLELDDLLDDFVTFFIAGRT